MPLCLPYKGTMLQGLARDDYISQGALLPLSGGIAPLPVWDAVEASERAIVPGPACSVSFPSAGTRQ